MEIKTAVIARFIVWLFKTYKVSTGNCIAWFYDECGPAVAQEINLKVIEEVTKQNKP